MRIITIGEKEIGIKATPLSLLYYRQEFQSDLVGDLVKMQVLANDPSALDSVVLLQMTWAMNKSAEGTGKVFPDFESWLAQFEWIDFSNMDTMMAILDEAEKGFFRQAARGAIKPNY